MNDFVYVANWSISFKFITSIHEFHSVVEKQISLAVYCLTFTWPVAILFIYQGVRLYFSKPWTKITEYVAVSRWFSRRVTPYNTPHVCGLSWWPYTGCFCPVTSDSTHLFIIFITDSGGVVDLLVIFRSFWILSSWVEAFYI